ncbi:MAG: hypothetical protein M0Q51_10265 [Bacteroidales bacterium]|nr:hypothetical protein [Bacteroidales bacterium]
MTRIEEILQEKIKPKEKQIILVESLVSKEISMEDFIMFFESASDIDKGTCADVMKHVSDQKPELLKPYIDILVKYINYKAPRVKWGVPEAIGNLAKDDAEKTATAIPYLLKNTTDDKINTAVIKWCAAFALTEIAKHYPGSRKQLMPIFEKIIREEKNDGVKNVYVKAIKIIEKNDANI